jgi:alpha-L-fucosidase
MDDFIYSLPWSTLTTKGVPRWLYEAKFGIYTHWGVYSVPACGPNGSWYPYFMYRPGSIQHQYHVKNYGDPSKFGYKDFIPMFKGEKFNADDWAELFKKAGARFAGPVAEHHDGFSLWDSKVNEWNSAKMGPCRDVVGELEKAIRRRGMKFMVAFHHAENWWFFPHWKKEYDTSDPKYSGLYGPLHNQEANRDLEWHEQDKPTQDFLEKWKNKIIEVIEKYRPDLMWFDFGFGWIRDSYRREVISYYFRRAYERNKEVALVFKPLSYHYRSALRNKREMWIKAYEKLGAPGLPPGLGVPDLELGVMGDLTYHIWMTDTSIDKNGAWSYIQNIEYKSTRTLIHTLVDIVSKNGILLLNVGPKANGEIPEEAVKRLTELGEWLNVNGEAIYGTVPWVIYGEEPTKIEDSLPFNEMKESSFTVEDIRFTTKNKTVYAISLGVPEEKFLIKSLMILDKSEVDSVELLDVEKDLKWSLDENGMKIILPQKKDVKHACVFKIVLAK